MQLHFANIHTEIINRLPFSKLNKNIYTINWKSFASQRAIFQYDDKIVWWEDEIEVRLSQFTDKMCWMANISMACLVARCVFFRKNLFIKLNYSIGHFNFFLFQTDRIVYGAVSPQQRVHLYKLLHTHRYVNFRLNYFNCLIRDEPTHSNWCPLKVDVILNFTSVSQ